MAEGGEAGIEGEGRREAKVAATPNPFAAALALGAAAHDPAAAAAATAFLDQQHRLTALQVTHFDQEHRLAVDAARIERALGWMKLAMQGAITLVLVGLVIGLFHLTWSAAHDHGLVLEAFVVPPDLQRSQIDGNQLAGIVADKIALIETRSDSFRADKSFSTDWGDDIKLDLPGAGVSIGELDRVMRRQLGHQTRIGGTLYHDGDALRLSLRTGDGVVEVRGDAGHLDQLAQAAAEAVFARTLPYRYSKFLEFNGRRDEALAVARASAATADDPHEQAWAWAQISNLLSARDLPACVAAGRRAIAFDPDNALAWLNASNCEHLMGHSQASLEMLIRATDLAAHGGGGLSQVGITTGAHHNRGWVAYLGGDPQGAAAIFSEKESRLYAGIAGLLAGDRSVVMVAAHDVSGSLRNAGAGSDARLVVQLYYSGNYQSPDFDRAVALDDWPAALAAADAQLAALAPAPEGPELTRYARDRFVLPHRALALASLGRIGEAWAIARALPTDCYLCLRTRAMVEARGGDTAGAARDFAAAIAANPSLRTADFEWGQALLVRHDLAGAKQHFERAIELAPRWADARKGLGDALIAERRYADAADAYAAAAERAPRWGADQLMWGRALWLAGSHEAARARFAAAATMDLSALDRRWLARLQAVTAAR